MFGSQRVLAQYLGVNFRSDNGATAQLIAPGSAKVENKQCKSLKKSIYHMKETRNIDLKFNKLDVNSVRVVVLSNTSFANTPGMKSQFEFVVLIVDDQNQANIVHYGSSNCHRVSRSLMVAELHMFVHTFDIAYMIRETLEELLGRQIHLEAFVDRQTLFNVISNDGRTAERRLQLYFCVKGELQERRTEAYRTDMRKRKRSRRINEENDFEGVSNVEVDDEKTSWKLMRSAGLKDTQNDLFVKVNTSSTSF